jgi:hypothetical protein
MQIWKSTAGGPTSKAEGVAFLWKDARPHWLIMCCKLLTFQQGKLEQVPRPFYKIHMAIMKIHENHHGMCWIQVIMPIDLGLLGMAYIWHMITF